jgi:transcriptional regulator with XRE-family HTH domain
MKWQVFARRVLARDQGRGSGPGIKKMDSAEFKAWRKSLGLKQKEAAEKLGLKKRMIQYYETGRRGSKKVTIPKTVELACTALSLGIEGFDGVALADRTGAPPADDAAEAPSGRMPHLRRKEAA